MIEPGGTIGILGGGQLGRMSTQAARSMGYRIWILEEGDSSPAGQAADGQISGSYKDPRALEALAQHCDVVTLEFENIPSESLEALEERLPIRPGRALLEISQHREKEKNFLNRNGFPTTRFAPIHDPETLALTLAEWKRPAILKTATFGYDGKGQVRIESPHKAESAWRAIGEQDAILEEVVDFIGEFSAIVARNPRGDVRAYPLFENSHRHHILDYTFSEAAIDERLEAEGRQLAGNLAEQIGLEGILCIELFLTADHRWLVNELAPRPHNSGHGTIEGHLTSQFEQHIRAVADLPLGDTDRLRPGLMINLLGDLWHPSPPNWSALLRDPAVKLHLYDKGEPRRGRKMGHLHLLGPDRDDLCTRGNRLRCQLGLPPIGERATPAKDRR